MLDTEAADITRLISAQQAGAIINIDLGDDAPKANELS